MESFDGQKSGPDVKATADITAPKPQVSKDTRHGTGTRHVLARNIRKASFVGHFVWSTNKLYSVFELYGVLYCKHD